MDPHDAQLSAVARAVAAVLGYTPSQPHGWGVILTGPAGQTLLLQPFRGQAGRIHISGQYPDADAALGLPRHHITAAISRGPAAIAADITRRLLPACQADLTQAHEHASRRAREDTQRAQVAARLLATLRTAHISLRSVPTSAATSIAAALAHAARGSAR